MDMDTINIFSYWYNLVETFFVTGFTWLYQHFIDFAWIIKVAAISLTVSAVLILISIFRIIKLAFQRRSWNRINKRLMKKYGDGLTYILSKEAKPNMTRDEVLEALGLNENDTATKELLKNWKEKLAFSRLLYQQRISDDSALGRQRNVQVILGIFGLQEFLESVINKDKMKYKVEAMTMLRSFKVNTNQWVANQLINSKRKRVQRLAMYSSIMSSSNTDLGYFESEFFDENCCLYDEIQLGFILQRRKSSNRVIPNLAHWAHMQKNPSTQCVFVRLMRQFDQREYCNELEDLLTYNTDKELVQEISRTWGYLDYREGEDIMMELLFTQPDDTKVAIMHALTRLNTGKSLNALVDAYTNSGSPHVKFEALRCLYQYGEVGHTKFMELEMKASAQDRKLFEFFHNREIHADLPLQDNDLYHAEYGDNLYGVY